jgi:hypothetical protein
MVSKSSLFKYNAYIIMYIYTYQQYNHKKQTKGTNMGNDNKILVYMVLIIAVDDPDFLAK